MTKMKIQINKSKYTTGKCKITSSIVFFFFSFTKPTCLTNRSNPPPQANRLQITQTRVIKHQHTNHHHASEIKHTLFSLPQTTVNNAHAGGLCEPYPELIRNCKVINYAITLKKILHQKTSPKTFIKIVFAPFHL